VSQLPGSSSAALMRAPSTFAGIVDSFSGWPVSDASRLHAATASVAQNIRLNTGIRRREKHVGPFDTICNFLIAFFQHDFWETNDGVDVQ
jgi:hypothetical protein